RDTKQKVGEIQSRRRAGERKGTTWILLRQDVEQLPSNVPAKGQIVPAMILEAAIGNRMRLISIEGKLRVCHCRRATREGESWRAPVDGILIISCDTGSTGDIQTICEERRRARPESAELVPEGCREPLGRPGRPVDCSVETE